MPAPTPELIATMRPAISAGWFYVPYEAIGTEQQINAVKRKLTHHNRDTGAHIRMFKDLRSQGYLGVPRAYGMLTWAWLHVDDQTTIGDPMIDPTVRLPSPNHPSVKEPMLQQKFMDDMEQATHSHKHFIAYATTGSGKTVVGSRNAALLHRKTAIFVPLERLMGQWRDELIDKLGVPEHRIGIVQGDTCQWKERDYVLCMMKSLGVRRYPSEFYQSIGHVLVDECHRIATAELAMTTALFAARYRIGLSATPEKSNGSDRVIFWHIGPMKVKSEATAVDCDVYTWRYDDHGRMAQIPPLVSRPGEPKKPEHGFRIKKLTEDENRNRGLARMVYRLWKARKPEHGVLAIGEHVAHVQRIMDLCEELGMPRSVMGQCTADRHVFSRGVVVNGKMTRRLLRKVKIKEDEFNLAKETGEVVFATYGCFKEGIDEKRLAAGIDLTPQAKAKQAIGRVRRPFAGKIRATWVTPVDTGDYMSVRYYNSRMRDYTADGNVRVIHGRL